MIITQIIGYIAAVVGTSVMIPQLYKSYKTKRVNDISSFMLGLYFINCILWSVYGILLKEMPIILCNLVALTVITLQIIIKIRHQKK